MSFTPSLIRFALLFCFAASALGEFYIIDGTWASDEGGIGFEAKTNCQRLRDDFVKGSCQVFFHRGPGNAKDNASWTAQRYDAITGQGSMDIVNEVYEQIVKNWNEAERIRLNPGIWKNPEGEIRCKKEIYLAGWSRGAAIAGQVTHKIFDEGIPNRVAGGYLLFPEDADCAVISQIHLMDTVHSMGVPGNDINPGWKDKDLPPNIYRAFHYLAAAPPKLGFKQTRWRSAAEEVHCGGHGDIGGSAGSACSAEVYRSIICNMRENNATIHFKGEETVQCPALAMDWNPEDGSPIMDL